MFLAEAKVGRRYWPEVIKTAAYLKNRTLTNTIEKKTPYEIFFKIKPSLENLKLYGSPIFVRIPEEKRKSKWDKKAELGVLLGYSEVEYRVLIKNKIVIARHVDIIEEDIKCIGFKVNIDEETKNMEHEEEKIQTEVNMLYELDYEKNEINTTNNIDTRSKRQKGFLSDLMKNLVTSA